MKEATGHTRGDSRHFDRSFFCKIKPKVARRKEYGEDESSMGQLRKEQMTSVERVWCRRNEETSQRSRISIEAIRRSMGSFIGAVQRGDGVGWGGERLVWLGGCNGEDDKS